MADNRPIKSAQGGERRLTFKIDASAGTLLLGANQGTIVDNGVGDFTITFTEPFRRVAELGGWSCEIGDTTVSKTASTVSTIQVAIETAGVAADEDCVLTVVGWDSADER